MTPELFIATDPAALARAVANEVLVQAGAAVQASGRFTLVLAGGSTPRALYSLLVQDASLRRAMPWDSTHFFWGDERHVPPDHAQSNYRMAHEAMLSKVPVPLRNIHRVPGERADPLVAAEEYEKGLREFFQNSTEVWPRFDLVLLGLGADGHTASLFPGTKAMHERQRWVAANWVEKQNSWRITLTFPVLNAAACVAFVVSGEDKAKTVRSVLRGHSAPDAYPAQLIQPADGRLLWFLDSTAARDIGEPRSPPG